MNRVEIERDGAIAVLRLNRPEVLNAIDQAMWTDLLDAFRAVAADPSVRVCLLTGNGRGFCSGADLKETAWHGETPRQSRARTLAEQIAACAPASVSRMKRTLYRLSIAELETALGLETDALVAMYSESAIDEAREAFAGRRRD